jgi:hypothetical protein
MIRWRILTLVCLILGIFGCAIGRLGFGVYYRGMPFLEAPHLPPFLYTDGRPAGPVPWSLGNLTESEWYHLVGLAFLAATGAIVLAEAGWRSFSERKRSDNRPLSGQTG